MGEIDRKAQSDYHIPEAVLMENAGIKLYNYLVSDVWNNSVPLHTVFIAGKGNNGGDVLVMARQHFLSGCSCIIIVPDLSFRGGLPETHLDICSSLGIEIIDWENDNSRALSTVDNADWIIEGLSGTGLKGELKNTPARIAEYINRSKAEICSVDVPSGIGENYRDGCCSVEADVTLTVGLPKFPLFTPSGRKKCGKIIRVPIGFPPPLIYDEKIKDSLLEYDDLKKLITPPSPYSHKNTKGHTLILAGSKGMTGAAKMCASSALNSMSGLVTLKAEEDVFSFLSDISPSVITGTENYSCYYESSVNKYSSAAIGPGWGYSEKKKRWLKSFISESSLPAVIDADGLNILSEILAEGTEIKNSNCVLTPHIGEFSKLASVSKQEIMDNPGPFLTSFSKKYKVTVVLKSHVIWISSPDGYIQIIDGNNPAMATAGSGDILTGIIAGLMSYGLDSLRSAAAGALLHQYSGFLCYNENGFFKSEKLIEYIGKALYKVFSR